MFVKVILCAKKDLSIVLNVNRIISMNSLKDGYVYVRADLGSTKGSDACMIKLEDLIAVVNDEPAKTQVMEWLKEQGYDESSCISEPEPNSLGEICEVSFVLNRVVLAVNKGKIEASKKFGLLDNYERYEFDGNHMYFYCPGSVTADFTITCGNEDYACTHSPAAILNMSNPTHAVKRCRKVIKTEMAKQCREKMIAIPNNIASDLSRNTNCSIDDFMVMKEKKT